MFSRSPWAPRWLLAAMVDIHAAINMTGKTQSRLMIQIKEKMVPLLSPTEVPGDQALRVESSIRSQMLA